MESETTQNNNKSQIPTQELPLETGTVEERPLGSELMQETPQKLESTGVSVSRGETARFNICAGKTTEIRENFRVRSELITLIHLSKIDGWSQSFHRRDNWKKNLHRTDHRSQFLQ